MALMGFFERQFRKQFRPVSGGYLFRHDSTDYWFEAEEVADFVAEWRKHWANPLVWAAYLLLGMALPIWFYFNDFFGFAFVLGIVAGIAMLVNLVFPWREPHEVAAGRAPSAEIPQWQPPTGVRVLVAFGVTAALGAIAWYSHKPDRPGLSSSDIIPIFLALHMGWAAMVELVLWLRARRATAQPTTGNGWGTFAATAPISRFSLSRR
ncbi:MAG: hypothetical protein EOP62_00185 [Sphingomonadales bacterium]|nr:MAG: hypothetical protein EOP62_00185 [Sphingomonadales bacterium]